MKETNPPVRVYDVSHSGEFVRAIVTRDGCFSIISSFGNFGIWWSAPCDEIRSFIVSSGPDYIANSLLHGRHGHRNSEREMSGLMRLMWPKVREAIEADLVNPWPGEAK